MQSYYDHNGITIYHGDCLEVMASMPNQSIDMIWTDPPYGHSNNDGDLNAMLAKVEEREAIAIANDTPETFRIVFDGMLKQAARILKRECSVCCCCCGGGGPSPTFAWVANRMDQDGFQFFHSVIWDKIMPGLGWRYRRQHEMVMVAHRKGGKLAWANPDRSTSNIVRMHKPREGLHPNEKPVGLPQHFIGLHTKDGDVVLDPFMGSGTTLVAAKLEGRRAIGIEMEERYCEMAVKRLGQEVLPFA